MSKQRMIVAMVVCLSLTVIAGQGPSGKPAKLPPSKSPGKAEDIGKTIADWHAQSRQQELKKNEEYMRLMSRQAWKRLLKVSDHQWNIIEGKYKPERALDLEARVRAPGYGGMENFKWHRRTEIGHGSSAKTTEEMTEGERIVEELIDLLEDEKSKDREIRKKVDALQQARDNAWKALPKYRRELAAVLTTPRQEAIFLLLGCID